MKLASKQAVISALQLGIINYEQLEESWKKDRDVILASIENIAEPERLPDELKNDQGFMVELVKRFYNHSSHYASEALQNNKEFVKIAVQVNGENLQYASETLRNDKEIVLEAVRHNWFALRFANENLQNDPDVIQTAKQGTIEYFQTGKGFGIALEEGYQNDKDVVLAAVNSQGYYLQYASDDLKNDKEVVLAAVSKSGYALSYASERLRNDKEVVLTAVQTHGSALKFANDDLKNDKEVVLAAVKNEWAAFKSASQELQHDKDIAIATVSGNPFMLHEIDQQDVEICITALQKFDESWNDMYQNNFEKYDEFEHNCAWRRIWNCINEDIYDQVLEAYEKNREINEMKIEEVER